MIVKLTTGDGVKKLCLLLEPETYGDQLQLRELMEELETPSLAHKNFNLPDYSLNGGGLMLILDEKRQEPM